MGIAHRLRLYWHTVRHLRSPQIWGRIAHRCFKPPVPAAKPAPARARLGTWVQPARREASLRGPDTFRFLGTCGSLAQDGWDGPSKAKLWRYNQHYFDDLNAMGAQERLAWHLSLLASWREGNPPGLGSGWEPYPTSLRIVNWIKWALATGHADTDFLDSLALQTRWLARRLETHLLGNHLFVNAKALVFAGTFFDGEEAREWHRIGVRLLQQEIQEQILGDGGQFERSPMYHALALEDMLDLLNLQRASKSGVRRTPIDATNWDGRLVERMWRWLHLMSHADGAPTLFNDCASGIAPSLAELDAYAANLGLAAPSQPESVEQLADSGYIRLQAGAAVAWFDAAPVGPDYLPAHAHADTLSLELTLENQRVLVNSGTSVYAEGPERQRQRGTAAHNTVVIDQRDSSEVWGSFRVARRARPLAIQVVARDNELTASAAHDGYRHLPGCPTHHRSLRLSQDGCVIEDRIEGRWRSAASRWHFHPDVLVSLNPDGQSGVAQYPGGRQLTWRVQGGRARIEDSTWHPAFGLSMANQCLHVDWIDTACSLTLQWNIEPTAIYA